MPPDRDSYRHGDLRKAVLREATTLIESEGPSAVSMRAVARKAGVTHAAPYHHFPDKASLLRAVAEEGFVALAAAMNQAVAAASDPLAELAASGMAYVEFGLANPGLFRLMFRPELTGVGEGEVPATYTASWDTLVAVIERCQAAGHSRTADPATLATLCWSTVHGVTTLWLDRPLQPARAADPGEDARVGREVAERVVQLLNDLIA